MKNGISVIIPTFNRVKYLYPTLICLCNQKDLPCEFEIIIIDSGDDGTDKLVLNYKRNSPVKIKYKKIKHSKNRSLLRNKGVSLAQYEIICFLDNDMLVPPDFIKRHWEEHRNEKSVGIGLRKFLIDFDINKYGINNLIENFYLLEELPWYIDERNNIDINIEPWRYVYTHSLSLSKKEFLKLKGFKKKFGNNWGFEDIELGYRLMQDNCDFSLIKNLYSYHQPHFNQSNKEQHELNNNCYYFLTLHSCYQVELCLSFYNDYDKYNLLFEELHNNYKINYYKGKFDLIVASVFSHEENKSRKYKLGAILPYTTKTKKRILIDNFYFKIPELIQYSIFSEAIRVGKNIFIVIENDNEKKIVVRSAGICGYIINLRQFNEKIYKIEILSIKKTDLYTVLLPQVFFPENRVFYICLGNKLINEKKIVLLEDLQNTKTLKDNDFSYVNDCLSVSNFNTHYGMVNTNCIFSHTMLQSDTRIRYFDSKQVYIFDDDVIGTEQNKSIINSNIIPFDDYSDMTFLFAYEIFNNIKKQYNYEITEDVCCFMENGFYEDGIDLVISFFKNKLIKKNNYLKIKIPDYSCLFENSFPKHNQFSKNSKLFLIKQKYEQDLLLLKNLITSEELNDKVQLVICNMNMEDINNFLLKSKYVCFFSRTKYVPIEIYLAILNGRKVFLGKHHLLTDKLKKMCVEILSKEIKFSEGLKMPVNSENINYKLYNCEIDKVDEKLIKQDFKIKNIPFYEIYNEKKEVMQNFVNNLR